MTKALVAGMALALAAAGVQQRASQPIRTQTNLVRVDMYATHDGTPVEDLAAGEVTVYEDGKPQVIDHFEHIVVGAGVAVAGVTEPNSVAEANDEVADPHRRAFVIFLDPGHVTVAGSHDIRGPLIDFLSRALAPDDLVALMTPDMSLGQLTFGRRTDVLERELTEHWYWGRSESDSQRDAREREYDTCYPPDQRDRAAGATTSRIAAGLMARRRERLVLDSLHELILHMRSLRDGRTSVITVTSGWTLFKPDQSLTELQDFGQQGQERVPGRPPIGGLQPGSPIGRRGTDNNDAAKYACDTDRAALAALDDEEYFRQIVDEANHSNVSFYPVDPAGLRAFATPISEPLIAPSEDVKLLQNQQDTLRVLAANTDGVALLNSNDLRAQVRRIADDLTSYYLLTYYSTNAKPDGKFHAIAVHTTRPGVAIRARRGYRAPSAAELALSANATATPVVSDSARTLRDALGTLDGASRATGGPSNEPRVLHRGPITGNRYQPAESRVFARNERLRFEIDASVDETLAATLITRTGTRLTIPVPVSERTDGDRRILVADLTLAPLGAGDYVVELARSKGQMQTTVFVAVRVTQ